MTHVHVYLVHISLDSYIHSQMSPEVEEEYYRETHFEPMFRSEVIAYSEILPALDSAVHFPR